MQQRVVTSSDCRRPKGTELPKFPHLDTAFFLVVTVVVVYLTLTNPLRIQPWSQDRRNQAKSNRISPRQAGKEDRLQYD